MNTLDILATIARLDQGNESLRKENASLRRQLAKQDALLDTMQNIIANSAAKMPDYVFDTILDAIDQTKRPRIKLADDEIVGERWDGLS